MTALMTDFITPSFEYADGLGNAEDDLLNNDEYTNHFA